VRRAVEIAGNVPEVFFGCDPIERAIAEEREGAGVAHHYFLSFRREIFMEAGERELSDCFVDGFAIPQDRVIGFADRAPIRFPLKQREHMIVVFAVGFEIKEKRPLSVKQKDGGSEQCPFYAVRFALAQHPSRRHAGLALFFEVNRQCFQEILYFYRSIQAAEYAQLVRSEMGFRG